MMQPLTRRSLLACLAAIPLASAWAELAAPADDEPIWDFEISDVWPGSDEFFVSALRRGSIVPGLPEDVGWGAWMFGWPAREAVERMGYHAWCDWMIGDEWEDGRVGTITVQFLGEDQMQEAMI